MNFFMKPITKMPNMTLFQVFFSGPKYGLGFDQAFGRIFVENPPKEETICRGDVLVSIEGHPLHPRVSFRTVVEFMRNVLQNPPVRLIFGRDADLTKMYVHFKTLKQLAMEKHRSQTHSAPAPAQQHETQGQVQAPHSNDSNRKTVAASSIVHSLYYYLESMLHLRCIFVFQRHHNRNIILHINRLNSFKGGTNLYLL